MCLEGRRGRTRPGNRGLEPERPKPFGLKYEEKEGLPYKTPAFSVSNGH